MLIAYWSAKGGSGATVLAAAHALRAATHGPTLLVDIAGDIPWVIGSPSHDAGISQWLAAGAQVPTDALDRIAVVVAPNLGLLCRGTGPLEPRRGEVLADILATTPRTVVVDCGTRPGPVGRAVARAADRSILVTRACYVAIRRQMEHDLAPTEVAVIREPHRSLKISDLASALGAPVRSTISLDPNISRAVDAGLLQSRLPRALSRNIAVAERVPSPRRRVLQ